MLIATRHAPPFVILDDGEFTGIAIALMRRISEGWGVEIRFIEMGLSEMLDAVAAGTVGAAVGALTITAERERILDFTHPFYTTGIGVAVPVRETMTWITALRRVASEPFLTSLAALLGLLTLLGALVWAVERRRNEQFPAAPIRGIGAGLWWSAVTMTTVGYGDKAPITLVGRLIALVWMFASIIVISGFTAAIASSLTVGALDESIGSVEDLYGTRVVSIEGSTSSLYLTDKLIRHHTVTDAEAALQELVAGRADAVVHDAPILRYLVQEQYVGRLRVLPFLLTRQDYGIALPRQTAQREEINVRILETIHTPEWERLVEGYLGRDGV
ncbi:ABC transporter substrate-binding protein [Thiocapsa imhoffii]|uniref:ABC transporter substrate-binding protein n=1 Tax=Thiocapsa imhoffii TaxID=382777 RepID=A0A9X1BAE6_9GAMM|nr:transporter substrate-binding domain-containing protein [Thiocapsa imhoffii]MBK1646011.1 ABC transporter substrate-binding protein [Thiocapsa imhoffii]